MPAARSFSRRRMLHGLGVTAGLGLAAPGLLAGCGDDHSADSEVRISNWPLYIDPDSVPGFQRQTGITAVYTEDMDDNDEFYARIKPQLSAGRSIDRDVITPTSWLGVRLRDNGWLQRLPRESMPEVKNLLPSLQMPWDPAGEWMLPWMSGMAGIAYNRDAAGRDLGKFTDLFDPAFKGRIGLLKEMRDTLGLAIQATGRDPRTIVFEDADPAFVMLERAVAAGQIAGFTGNDYPDKLASGEFVACVAWSGDIAQMAMENPAIRFVIPEEGGIFFSDVMCMPAFGANRQPAAAWMNYVYDPLTSARITAAVHFISPVKGVREVLAKTGGDKARLADNPLMFPDDALLARLRVFKDLSEEEEARFDARYSAFAGN